MHKYIPISCNYYDELEAIATRGIIAHIHYKDEEGNQKCVESQITDFKIANKVEFLVLGDGKEIRLDHLIVVNDLFLADSTNC